MMFVAIAHTIKLGNRIRSVEYVETDIEQIQLSTRTQDNVAIDFPTDLKDLIGLHSKGPSLNPSRASHTICNYPRGDGGAGVIGYRVADFRGYGGR